MVRLKRDNVHVFTSINLKYFAKARVLAKSLKKHNPNIQFHLMLSDKVPSFINLNEEIFDSIILLDDLKIEDMESFIFKHNVIELCTAVKPMVFKYLFNKYNCEKIFYFDPDILITSKIDDLISEFENNDILLTPHIVKPYSEKRDIIEFEFQFTKKGIFNLGFIGVNNSKNSLKFLDYWEERCLNFCYDDINSGLFVDQKWIDFVPVFFDNVKILKNPIYNIAGWNIKNRNLSGNLINGIYLGDKRVSFIHFSGIFTPIEKWLENRFKFTAPVYLELIKSYKQMCIFEGENKFREIDWHYGHFNNGSIIRDHQRFIYRGSRIALDRFKDPFDTNIQDSYYSWHRFKKFKKNAFDWVVYLNHNPDLRVNWNSPMKARLHYMLYSKKEKRRI